VITLQNYSLVPRLRSHTRNNSIVTFDPANFGPIFAHAVKGHTIVRRLWGRAWGRG